MNINIHVQDTKYIKYVPSSKFANHCLKYCLVQVPYIVHFLTMEPLIQSVVRAGWSVSTIMYWVFI